MSSERLIMFVSKFSRSPYLDNHLSKGIHTWNICSFHAIGPQGPCPGKGATGSKSSSCSKCGISGLKFSRSSYLDNHLSKSIHTWSKGTLYGWLSFHNIGPLCPCPDGARGQKLDNLQNVVFVSQRFLEVHILTSTFRKAFKLGPLPPYRVGFHAMTSNPRVRA